MTYRPMLALSREVSVIGFGAWEIGGAATFGGQPMGWGRVSKRAAVQAVNRALELGINFFDTADVYGWGRSEELLGQALTAGSDEALVCTKFGNRERSGAPYQDFSPAWLHRSVDGSLTRLKRERLDVLLLHGPPDDFNWRDFDPAAFETLRQEGKIGAFGVSCRTAAGARRVIENGFGSVVEVIYNMLDRRIQDVVLPLAADRGVAVIARMPLASGFLTEAVVDSMPHFSASDHRSRLPEADIAWRVAAVRRLVFLSKLRGGIAGSAIRFCFSHPAVTTVIPGMSTVAEVEASVRAAWQGPLTPMSIDRIVGAVPQPYGGW